jgi:hypothetical protein
VLGGFYFHPSDEDLSPGTPVEEKATWLYRFRLTPTLILLSRDHRAAGQIPQKKKTGARQAIGRRGRNFYWRRGRIVRFCRTSEPWQAALHWFDLLDGEGVGWVHPVLATGLHNGGQPDASEQWVNCRVVGPGDAQP